jgi:hypothetical protein
MVLRMPAMTALARMQDDLQVGLHDPPRRDLRGVAHFEDELIVTDRVRWAHRRRVLVGGGGVRADLGIGHAEAEHVIGAAGYEAGEAGAAVDIIGDQIAVGRRQAAAQEQVQAALAGAPHHLVGDRVKAPVAATLKRIGAAVEPERHRRPGAVNTAVAYQPPSL